MVSVEVQTVKVHIEEVQNVEIHTGEVSKLKVKKDFTVATKELNSTQGNKSNNIGSNPQNLLTKERKLN